VIAEEKDIDKAVSVVRWLMWLVGEHAPPGDLVEKQPPRSAQSDVLTWADAIHVMQGSLQRALGERGLPPVEFE
jgi:DNA repair protein REV1